MKKSYILKTVIFFTFFCLFTLSCSNKITDPPVGAHPNDADRAIPYSYSDWMANIDDNKYLSEITIPGTHDSGADLHSSEQGEMSIITIAQDFRISNQLMMGVRWFDIRLNDDNGIMTVFHGPYYLHKNFNNLITQALSFLDNHKTEVVIFMIKQENSSRSDYDFANGIMGYLNTYPNRFWLNTNIPGIGEARGKIVIVRQFESTHGYPMGAPLCWEDNTTGNIYSSDNNFYFYVQDHYSLNTVSLDTKIAQIEDCLTKAHGEPYPTRCYYLNFTSGEQDYALVPLEDIAAYINPRINTFLLSKPWHNCGIIFVNFAGGSDDGIVSQDLVKTIINTNESGPATVTIGTQVWMKRNLNVTKYRNGDPIPNVTDATAWNTLTTGAYCDYNNTPNAFGRIYNWYAVNDPRGIAPAGFHVASYDEWTTLIDYLGGVSIAGGKLKATGIDLWASPNTGATNETNFTAYPAGWRSRLGPFYNMGDATIWWSSSQQNNVNGWDLSITSWSRVIFYDYELKTNGYSIRCIKD